LLLQCNQVGRECFSPPIILKKDTVLCYSNNLSQSPRCTERKFQKKDTQKESLEVTPMSSHVETRTLEAVLVSPLINGQHVLSFVTHKSAIQCFTSQDHCERTMVRYPVVTIHMSDAMTFQRYISPKRYCRSIQSIPASHVIQLWYILTSSHIA
jgi:hypothetical protein